MPVPEGFVTFYNLHDGCRVKLIFQIVKFYGFDLFILLQYLVIYSFFGSKHSPSPLAWMRTGPEKISGGDSSVAAKYSRSCGMTGRAKRQNQEPTNSVTGNSERKNRNQFRNDRWGTFTPPPSVGHMLLRCHSEQAVFCITQALRYGEKRNAGILPPADKNSAAWNLFFICWHWRLAVHGP